MIVFPELFCPFPSALNCGTDIVQQQTLARVDHFRLIENPAVHRRFCAAQYSLIVGGPIPMRRWPIRG
jgi:5-epi-alpha-selinene synthase